MTTNDEVRSVEWTTDKPSRPGAYYVRGFNWGRNDEQYEALVQVASHWFLGDEAPSLVCNLHESTSEEDLSNWCELKELSEKFEWAGPLLPASTIQQLQAEVERLREDAERYRFIASNHSAAWEKELDTAIDAARAAQ